MDHSYMPIYLHVNFQNKRAKLKKSAQRAHQSAGIQNLMNQGIYKR